LRAGDTITAVDGKPLATLDDAAELYVRASTARNITVDLVRAGKPLTLRVAIQ
jgi:S1-C subfamily serine protease